MYIKKILQGERRRKKEKQRLNARQKCNKRCMKMEIIMKRIEVRATDNRREKESN
jgi:hypothetical protein